MKVLILGPHNEEVHAEISSEDYARLFGRKYSGYERNDTYFTINGSDVLVHCTDNHDTADEALYENANYYSNYDVAANCSRADTLMRRLRQQAALTGEIFPLCEAVQNSIAEGGYFIAYDAHTGLHPVHYSKMSICPGEICYRTLEGAKSAIKEFETELIWYFTEYYPIVR